MNKRAMICMAVGTAGLLTGCGDSGGGKSDEARVEQAAQDYVRALGTGDYDKACAQLSSKATSTLVSQARKSKVGTTCPAILGTALKPLKAQLAGLKTATVTKVKVNGAKATATIKGTPTPATLIKDGGDWKLSVTGFG